MDDKEQLDRLEERVRALELCIAKQLSKLTEQMEHLVRASDSYITRDRFSLVQTIVFGLVGMVLTGAVGAIGALLSRYFLK